MAPSWYTDLEVMAEDDRRLQALVATARGRLRGCPAAAESLRAVHVYPSGYCTYTMDKRRIFVRMRDAKGQPFPDCVLQYVLLHELAHVLNPSLGHDRSFQRELEGLRRCSGTHGGDCPRSVPADYNSCH